MKLTGLRRWCQHREIEITEIGSWTTSHYRDLNGGWSHNNEPGDYGSTFNVFCAECGLNSDYTRRTAPKWLKVRLDELDEANTTAPAPGQEGGA